MATLYAYVYWYCKAHWKKMKLSLANCDIVRLTKGMNRLFLYHCCYCYILCMSLSATYMHVLEYWKKTVQLAHVWVRIHLLLYSTSLLGEQSYIWSWIAVGEIHLFLLQWNIVRDSCCKGHMLYMASSCAAPPLEPWLLIYRNHIVLLYWDVKKMKPQLRVDLYFSVYMAFAYCFHTR